MTALALTVGLLVLAQAPLSVVRAPVAQAARGGVPVDVRGLPSAPLPVVRAPVAQAARGGAPVDVLVLLSAPPDDVLASLDAQQVRPYRRLHALKAFAARVTPAGLAALATHPHVLGVQLDRRLRPLTAESARVMGADVVRDTLGVTGKGVVVAALETGVDVAHPDLDGGVLAQKCFVLGGCPPGNTDVGDLAPEGSGHGTHVAGILTGDGVRAPKGLAPGSRLVMVRVFDDTSYGRESDWALAMEWVAANAAPLGVRVLNLSIGTDERYPGGCDADWPVMAAAAAAVHAAGVVQFGAAGNENEANALVAPACLTHVIAVGATYDAPLGREPDTGTYSSGCFDAATDAGTVMCLSNTSSELDVLAPGSRIRAAGPGDAVSERRGTSQATPHASATAALMLEVDPLLAPGDVLRILTATGVPTVDPKAPARVTPRVDARAAVEAVRAEYCVRRSDGAACPLALGPCGADAGACVGACVAGACSADAPTRVPAAGVEGGPAGAGGGCGCGPGGSGGRLGLSVALACAWLLARGRRRRFFPSPRPSAPMGERETVTRASA